jgi:hypothetical protein
MAAKIDCTRYSRICSPMRAVRMGSMGALACQETAGEPRRPPRLSCAFLRPTLFTKKLDLSQRSVSFSSLMFGGSKGLAGDGVLR